MSADNSHTRTKRVYQPVLGPKAFNFTPGTKFGRLTVDSRLGSSTGGTFFRCRCECGSVVEVRGVCLKRGDSRSCGCLKDEKASLRARTHGRSKTSEYAVFATMKRRCCSPKVNSYKDYGGRGITVCDRWLNGDGQRSGFECFLCDMGTRPSSRHSVERLDTNKGYLPENCVWATPREQSRNTRRNVHVTIGGVTKILVEWAEVSGLCYGLLQNRWAKGCAAENLLRPVKTQRNGRNSIFVTINGVTKNVRGWSVQSGLSQALIWKRLGSGCPPESLLRPSRIINKKPR